MKYIENRCEICPCKTKETEETENCQNEPCHFRDEVVYICDDCGEEITEDIYEIISKKHEKHFCKSCLTKENIERVFKNG